MKSFHLILKHKRWPWQRFNLEDEANKIRDVLQELADAIGHGSQVAIRQDDRGYHIEFDVDATDRRAIEGLLDLAYRVNRRDVIWDN